MDTKSGEKLVLLKNHSMEFIQEIKLILLLQFFPHQNLSMFYWYCWMSLNQIKTMYITIKMEVDGNIKELRIIQLDGHQSKLQAKL